MQIQSLPIIRLCSLIVLSIFLAACASSNSGSVYKSGEARKIQSVKTGIVESVRTVTLEGSKTIGTATGAAIGGIAGGSVGHGRGSTLGAVVGAVAGGIAGSAAEKMMTKKDGVEITIKLDGGQLIAIVQEADETFTPGEKVRIIENGGTARVSH